MAWKCVLKHLILEVLDIIRNVSCCPSSSFVANIDTAKCKSNECLCCIFIYSLKDDQDVFDWMFWTIFVEIYTRLSPLLGSTRYLQTQQYALRHSPFLLSCYHDLMLWSVTLLQLFDWYREIFHFDFSASSWRTAGCEKLLHSLPDFLWLFRRRPRPVRGGETTRWGK